MPRPKPVVKLDIDTKSLLRRFNSSREAGWKEHISYQAILDNCNHRNKTCGGFIFMWADEYEGES